MNPTTKKIIIWSSVAVVLGVGGYFLYKYLKNKPTNSNNNSDGQDGQDEQQPQNTPPFLSSNNDSSLAKTPFKNKGQGDYFRLWVNRWYPNDAKTLNLDKTGEIDNSTIRKAWAKYGLLYKQQVKNWDKIQKQMPQSFIDKFLNKDYYSFQIDENGNIYLVPKISELVMFHPNSAIYTNRGLIGTWSDEGKKASYRGAGSWDVPITYLTANNFYELAKKIKTADKK